MGAFKDQIGRELVGQLAAAIADVDPAFDHPAFVVRASDGLERLELKARVTHVADALDEHLTGPFGRAARVLCSAADHGRLGMWGAWPCVAYVEQRGLDDPEDALDALGRLTRHASAEFAVRPYLERHFELTMGRLREWAASPDVHLRRLVSEGTRPRLPWGRQLVALRRDPSPVLPLLDELRDDPEEYVRRSVANHLNDIVKDHPDLAIRVAQRWLGEGGAHVAPVVRHGMRSLVKAGHPDALALVGADVGAELHADDLRIGDPCVRIGETLRFSFTLRNPAGRDVRAVIDYVVHLRRANGTLTPKVFKLSARSLAPNATLPMERTHSFRPITTRRYYPGAHLLEVQINGRSAAQAEFELLA